MQKKNYKVQQPFVTKTLSKLGIKKNLINLIRNIYKNPTANIIHSAKRLTASPPRIRNKARMSALNTLTGTLPIVLEVLANAIRQENKIKGT